MSFSKDFCSSSMSSVAFVSVKKNNEITRLETLLIYNLFNFLDSKKNSSVYLAKQLIEVKHKFDSGLSIISIICLTYRKMKTG